MKGVVMEMLGFVAALISILGWGSYFVPMKKIPKYDPFYFQALMVTGIFASSLLFVSFAGKFIFNIFGLTSGFLWVIGNILSVIAVEKSGLARTAPVWMCVGMIVSFLWGLFFFKEALTNVVFAVLGVLLLVIGANAVSLSQSEKEKIKMFGIMLAAAAGIIFGTYLIPLKLSGLQATEFLFSMSLGILVSGWMIFLLKRPPIDRKILVNGLVCGAVWNIANFASLFAVLFLGYSVGFPLTQNALLVAVLWGLLYFKEVTQKNKVMQIILGAVILIAGAFLLGFSK